MMATGQESYIPVTVASARTVHTFTLLGHVKICNRCIFILSHIVLFGEQEPDIISGFFSLSTGDRTLLVCVSEVSTK